MLQQDDKPKTAQDPSSKGWAVLVSEQKKWREVAQISAILFVLALGVAAIGWAMWSGGDFASPLAMFQSRSKKAAEVAPAADAYKEPAYRRSLDGAPLDAPHSGDYVAVMIDNMFPARPASGLSKAVFLIEAPVESSITRIQAYIDPTDDIAKIGPVRSVRPYYFDWASEIDAMIAHVGGSPAALDLVKAGTLRDLNEFFNGNSFWRDSERYAPHNAYTSTEKLRAAIARNYPDRVLHPVKPWLFKDDVAHMKASPSDLVGDDAWPTMHIDYNASPYDVDWRYDAASNTYVREQGGKLQKDGDVPLRAKNVAVEFTTVKVLDEVGRRSVVTKGSGDAIVATDGKIIKGTWNTSSGRTRFYDEEGSEVVFNAGATWMQVVPIGFDVTFKNYQ